MADKPKLKYRVIPARNPSTGAALLRPVIAERDTLRTDQVVEYALNAGYVRGQFHDMRGALNGFIEAIQQLGRDFCRVAALFYPTQSVILSSQPINRGN